MLGASQLPAAPVLAKVAPPKIPCDAKWLCLQGASRESCYIYLHSTRHRARLQIASTKRQLDQAKGLLASLLKEVVLVSCEDRVLLNNTTHTRYDRRMVISSLRCVMRRSAFYESCIFPGAFRMARGFARTAGGFDTFTPLLTGT